MLLTLLSVTQKMTLDDFLGKLADWGIEVGKSILSAVIIYIVGRFLIKQISRIVVRFLKSGSWKSAFRLF